MVLTQTCAGSMNFSTGISSIAPTEIVFKGTTVNPGTDLSPRRVPNNHTVAKDKTYASRKFLNCSWIGESGVVKILIEFVFFLALPLDEVDFASNC